jgi:uncharacterized protein (UPF0332 family)
VKKKAVASLAACKALVQRDLADSAMNRLYYALYQAGVEALERQGRSPKGLDGDSIDGRWSHPFFRKNGSLLRGDSKDSKLFKTAFELRVRADYTKVPVEIEHVEGLLPHVEKFVAQTCS